MTTAKTQQQALLVLGVGLGMVAADRRAGGGGGGLTVLSEKPCGERSCRRGEFCSHVDNICRGCRDICDPASHNLQVYTCEDQCQDFLHDERYQVRLDSTGGYAPDQLARVQLISTISLILSLLALVGLLAGAALFFVYKRKINVFTVKKKKPSKKKDEPLKLDITRRNSGEISTIKLPTPDTTLDMPDMGQGRLHNPRTPQTEYTNLTTFKNHHARERSPDNASPPTPQSAYTAGSGKTATPLAKRHPSEDSTLDYAYDNPALAPSPVIPNGVSPSTTI